MARIAGINLPNEKRIQVGLTSVYGIGRSKSTSICKEAGVSLDKKVKDLSEQELSKLRDVIARISVEGDLRRKVQLDVKRLQEIGSYRGFRHKRGLPVRGQRTRQNARTRKGRKKTVANKKIITK